MLSLGIDVRDLILIDLLVEARMITLTHPSYWSFSAALIPTLAALGYRMVVQAQLHYTELHLTHTHGAMETLRILQIV